MIHDSLEHTLFGGLRPAHPFLGSTPPRPLWLPSNFESLRWPLLDDVEAFRAWLNEAIYNRSVAPSSEKLEEGIRSGVFLPAAKVGTDHPDVRDAFRLARHFAIKHGWQGLPAEPQRQFLFPHDSPEALLVLECVLEWLQKVWRQQDVEKNRRRHRSRLDDVRESCERWLRENAGWDGVATPRVADLKQALKVFYESHRRIAVADRATAQQIQRAIRYHIRKLASKHTE